MLNKFFGVKRCFGFRLRYEFFAVSLSLKRRNYVPIVAPFGFCYAKAKRRLKVWLLCSLDPKLSTSKPEPNGNPLGSPKANQRATKSP